MYGRYKKGKGRNRYLSVIVNTARCIQSWDYVKLLLWVIDCIRAFRHFHPYDFLLDPRPQLPGPLQIDRLSHSYIPRLYRSALFPTLKRWNLKLTSVFMNASNSLSRFPASGGPLFLGAEVEAPRPGPPLPLTGLYISLSLLTYVEGGSLPSSTSNGSWSCSSRRLSTTTTTSLRHSS